MMQGYQYGADYYITKPCTPTQLLYGVGLVLGRNFAEPSESVPQAGTSRASSSRATG
jgi:DNA-binding response OmpR family regulator